LRDLGLTLESRKAPLDVVVVDSIREDTHRELDRLAICRALRNTPGECHSSPRTPRTVSRYREDFISAAEETELAPIFAGVEFSNFEMRGVVRKRRVAFFGASLRPLATRRPGRYPTSCVR
jgi:hypothetical protein